MFEVKSSRKLEKGIKNKLLAGALSAALVIGAATVPAYAGTSYCPDVYINDKVVSYHKGVPFVEYGITYLPFTDTINRYRDYTVSFNNYTNEYVISASGTVIKLREGETTYSVNGKYYEAVAPVRVYAGVIYTPIGVVSVALDAVSTEIDSYAYNVKFTTNLPEVTKESVNELLTVIEKNDNLTYSEKNMIKDFTKKYFELESPYAYEFDTMKRVLSSVDITSKYDYNNKDFYTINKSVITINSARTDKISSNDSVRNALVHMFKEKSNVLLNDGVAEILAAESMKENTNHNPEMVAIAKMLSDIIGKDDLLLAYRLNDMNIIKYDLLNIFHDEALYNDFERLLGDISYNSDIRKNDNRSSVKRAIEKELKDDILHIYDIINTYYQCEYGRSIEYDDVMESYLIELLSHGEEKAFKNEPTIFSSDVSVYQIYNTPQPEYNRYASYYNYYYSSRPLNNKGNGMPLTLNRW